MRVDQRWREAERGQSLVEMAVGFVILILLVMGILDLGRAYFLNLALEDAAGEAALFLSLYPHCPVPPNEMSTPNNACAGANNAKYRALNSGSEQVDWGNATFTFEYYNGSSWSTTIPAAGSSVASGTLVRVKIRVSFRLLTPVVSAVVRNSQIELGSNAVSVVVST